MANIKLELTEPYNGQFVTFTAPCGCDSVDNGLVINGETYALVDAKGNTKAGVANTWTSGSKVAVVLDVTNKKAYIQNGIPTASDIGLGNVNNTSDANKPVSTAQATAIADAKKAGTDAQADIDAHIANTSNPHKVTKSQVGLGSVPNVTTNNQTPTYTQATSLATLTSGEKLSVSMGKIMKAITDLISHIGNKNNPHGATAEQVGAVPTSRTVNGKALSSNITLSASDVNARPNTWTPSASDVGALALNGSNIMCAPLYMDGNRISMSPDSNWSSGAYSSINHETDALTLTTRYNGVNRNFMVKNTSVELQKAIQFWDTPKNRSYNMFGENNKPIGSYTGNGSSTQRTIVVENILESRGLLLYAYKNNNAYASALVLQTGAILINSTGTVSGVPFAQARWSYGSGKGNLVLATTNACLNENGITYHYQVL